MAWLMRKRPARRTWSLHERATPPLIAIFMLSYIHNLECYRKPLRPHARVAHRRHGRPYRALYVFDPQRNAVLLICGDKTGNEQWYETSVPPGGPPLRTASYRTGRE